MDTTQDFDRDIRFFIYQTFSKTAKPPTSLEAADHFKVSIADVESAFDRLSEAHHIALAPGSKSIWMAHPFSGLPTNSIVRISGKKYWGN